MSQKVSYASSGVDISRQDEALKRIKPHVKGTKTPGVRSDIGLFGGLFDARFLETKPILVSSMDGVGTKMKVARRAGIWDTVGQDLVNHCINDILVQGARPLFFLDYIAAQQLEPEVIEQIVKGMATACTPAPGAWTTWAGERLKLGPVTVTDLVLLPGELAVGKRDVLVGTLTHAVRLGDVRPFGKREMPAADWARGARVTSGERLGGDEASTGEDGSGES